MKTKQRVDINLELTSLQTKLMKKSKS